MNKITPCLWFDGQAADAMKFYRSIFKTTKVLSVHRQGRKVLFVHFRLNGQEFMGLNGGPHFKFTPAVSFFVSCKTQKEVDHFWKKLSKGGKKGQCGWLTDKFGLSWQIVPTALGELMGDKDEKKSDRVFQAMMKMTKIDIKALKSAYNQK
jgi:predicted 3-demethylubiquinone-9 3-methyltransferase (glyoxalase superfamily)